MHEMTLALSILHLALDEAVKHKADHLTRVDLEIGVFAAVETHALAAAFELAAEGTAAEGAELNILRTPADATCLDCGHRFELNSPRDRCPVCKSLRLSVRGGRECRLVGLSASEAPANTSNHLRNHHESL